MSNYLRVFLTFARNSLVRNMTFRANFLIDMISSIAWVFINLAFYTLIFHYTPAIGAHSGWEKYQFFLFLATSLLINSLVQALFMTNADELSEMVRTGSLDFALLKPIDTQFLVSLTRIEWSSLGNFVVGIALMGYSMHELHYLPGPLQIVLYPIVCPVRRGDLLQPDDRHGGHQRVAGPQPVAVRLLVLHHQLFPLPDGDLPRPVGYPAAAASSRFAFRCWWW